MKLGIETAQSLVIVSIFSGPTPENYPWMWGWPSLPANIRANFELLSSRSDPGPDHEKYSGIVAQQQENQTAFIIYHFYWKGWKDEAYKARVLAQVRDEILGFVTLRTRNSRFRPIIVQLKY